MLVIFISHKTEFCTNKTSLVYPKRPMQWPVLMYLQQLGQSIKLRGYEFAKSAGLGIDFCVVIIIDRDILQLVPAQMHYAATPVMHSDKHDEHHRLYSCRACPNHRLLNISAEN